MTPKIILENLQVISQMQTVRPGFRVCSARRSAPGEDRCEICAQPINVMRKRNQPLICPECASILLSILPVAQYLADTSNLPRLAARIATGTRSV